MWRQILRAGIALAVLLVGACGGVVGPNGGTVNGPNGAQVVVPAGAVPRNTTLAITQTSAGSPALPAGVTAIGQMYAFTPHGTTFSKPVTVTVPFNTAQLPAGATATLYKTNASQTWEVVANATVNGATMTGQVSSFSYFVVGAEPVELVSMNRSWVFKAGLRNQSNYVTIGDPGALEGPGTIDDLRQIGGLFVRPDDMPDGAHVHAFSNDDGSTYWVSAQASATNIQDPARLYLAYSQLDQHQTFVKTQADATLRLTISQIVLETMDVSPDGGEPRGRNCENLPQGIGCGPPLNSVVQFWVRARAEGQDADFYNEESVALLDGSQQDWIFAAVPMTKVGLWSDQDPRFEFDSDVEPELSGGHAKVMLEEPIIIEIPLDTLHVGDKFMLISQAWARAIDERHNASYSGAFLRDPHAPFGVSIEFVGLTPAAPSDDEPPPPPDPQAPAQECESPNSAAGKLQFAAASFSVREGRSAGIHITRTEGAVGEVSALLTASDGSANQNVVFGAGQGGRRYVEIATGNDNDVNGNRTVNLQLSDPRGCATLGSPASAGLTIIDDDGAPPPAPRYSVTLTVSGLAGSGLVVDDVVTGARVTPAADGQYALSYPYPDGQAYDVRVITQPSSPIQECTIANGHGTIQAADVADIAVTCVTLPPSGALDQSYGQSGKVVINDLDGALAVVLQSTGRAVVLTGQTGAPTLARFTMSGAPDANFGTNGRVTVRFTGGILEEAYGLTVQPDDKLVVLGRARVGNRFDMGVARFNANGSPDLSFGTQGVTLIDPFAAIPSTVITNGNHRANKALIMPDGRILIAGAANFRDGLTGDPSTSYAVARLNDDGTPDPFFGGNGNGRGVVTFSLSPGTDGADIAYGLAVQSDGKIVLAGSTDGSEYPGLARFRPNGQIDADDPPVLCPNDPNGNYGRDARGFMVTDILGHRGIAQDIVMLDQNDTVSAVMSVENVPSGLVASRIYLMHIGVCGQPPGSSDAFTPTPLGPDNDYASQLIRLPDGKLLLAGTASSTTTVSDLAVVRYTADLQLDATFGVNGAVLIDFFGARDSAAGVAVQADGKIIAAGFTRNGSSDVLGIVRINP